MNFTAQCHKEKFKSKNGEMKEGIKVKCKLNDNAIPFQDLDVRKLNEQLLSNNFEWVENANLVILTLQNVNGQKFIAPLNRDNNEKVMMQSNGSDELEHSEGLQFQIETHVTHSPDGAVVSDHEKINADVKDL